MEEKLPELVGKGEENTGIVITHEIINQVKKEKKRGFRLKLDFNRAYDRLNWDCFMEVIKTRNFGPR